MAIVLKVDSEPSSIHQPLVPAHGTSAMLTLGDFHFIDETGQVKLIIERKAIPDLSASIVDGRYREQRKRLADSAVPYMYIFEGPITHKESVPQATLLGALVNMALIYKIPYVQTNNIDQTVQVVLSILSKLNEGRIPTEAAVPPNVLVSKKTARAKDLFPNQLALIPGVSLLKAKIITRVYANFKELLDVFESEGPEALYKRGLVGQILSRRIYEALK